MPGLPLGLGPYLWESAWAGEQLVLLGLPGHSWGAGELSRRAMQMTPLATAVLSRLTSHQQCEGPDLCTVKVLILYFAYMLIKEQRPLHLLGEYTLHSSHQPGKPTSP